MLVKIGDDSYKVFWKYSEKPARKHKKVRVTTCLIEDQNTKDTYTGVAQCSVTDNFCKDTGRTIAMTRALKDFERWEREEFWYRYHTRDLKNLDWLSHERDYGDTVD